MATTTTIVTTCDKCKAVIPPASKTKISLRVSYKGKKLPFPDSAIACTPVCGAAILSANATALTS